MISKVELENFKCIEKASLQFSPLTVIIGPNGSGKSAVLHSIMILKKFIFQTQNFKLENLGDFLYADYINIGSFEELIYLHRIQKRMLISLEFTSDTVSMSTELTLRKPPSSSESKIRILKPLALTLSMPFRSFPYQPQQAIKTKVNYLGTSNEISWNGINIYSTGPKAHELNKLLSLYREVLSKTFLFHLRQAFRAPVYPAGTISINLNKPILTEMEVLNYLSQPSPIIDDILEKISYYLQNLIDMEISVRASRNIVRASTRMRGIARFVLSSEGLGSNRLAYMLMTLFLPQVRVLLIEEPEVHLHPNTVFKLGKAFAEIVKNARKQIILTTHSEHLLIALLSSVAKGILTPEDLTIYYFEKKGSKTKINKLKVTKTGQVEGGLPGFFESDWNMFLEYLKSLSTSTG